MVFKTQTPYTKLNLILLYHFYGKCLLPTSSYIMHIQDLQWKRKKKRKQYNHHLWSINFFSFLARASELLKIYSTLLLMVKLFHLSLYWLSIKSQINTPTSVELTQINIWLPPDLLANTRDLIYSCGGLKGISEIC